MIIALLIIGWLVCGFLGVLWACRHDNEDVKLGYLFLVGFGPIVLVLVSLFIIAECKIWDTVIIKKRQK